jgi:LacI family transcriptional regulator
MGVLKATLDSGLRVPQDIAVIGCGNVHNDELLRVPLSSVDQDSANMGRQAAELALSLVQQSKGERARPRTILLPPTLVVRESTRRQV